MTDFLCEDPVLIPCPLPPAVRPRGTGQRGIIDLRSVLLIVDSADETWGSVRLGNNMYGNSEVDVALCCVRPLCCFSWRNNHAAQPWIAVYCLRCKHSCSLLFTYGESVTSIARLVIIKCKGISRTRRMYPAVNSKKKKRVKLPPLRNLPRRFPPAANSRKTVPTSFSSSHNRLAPNGGSIKLIIMLMINK